MLKGPVTPQPNPPLFFCKATGVYYYLDSPKSLACGFKEAYAFSELYPAVYTRRFCQGKGYVSVVCG